MSDFDDAQRRSALNATYPLMEATSEMDRMATYCFRTLFTAGDGSTQTDDRANLREAVGRVIAAARSAEKAAETLRAELERAEPAGTTEEEG